MDNNYDDFTWEPTNRIELETLNRISVEGRDYNRIWNGEEYDQADLVIEAGGYVMYFKLVDNQ